MLAAIAVTAPAGASERDPFDGLYIGLNAGYSWQDLSGVFDNEGDATDLSGLNINGAIIGGQLGYNYQTGQFLIGIEADLSTLAQDGTVVNDADDALADSLNADIVYLGSVRGRLGWAINNWLLFGTVGWGYSELKFTENSPNATPPFHGTIRLKDDGLVYGGGVEVLLAYGVSLRGEFLRYDLGRATPLPGDFEDVDPGDYISSDNIDVARAAINIRLSP
jgi:outer membrane immunogenic protein